MTANEAYAVLGLTEEEAIADFGRVKSVYEELTARITGRTPEIYADKTCFRSTIQGEKANRTHGWLLDEQLVRRCKAGLAQADEELRQIDIASNELNRAYQFICENPPVMNCPYCTVAQRIVRNTAQVVKVCSGCSKAFVATNNPTHEFARRFLQCLYRQHMNVGVAMFEEALVWRALHARAEDKSVSAEAAHWALTAYPDHPVSVYGVLCTTDGTTRESESLIRRVLQVCPRNVNLWTRLGDLYAQTEMSAHSYRLSKGAYARGLSLSGNTWGLCNGLARLRRRYGWKARLYDFLDAISGRKPISFETL